MPTSHPFFPYVEALKASGITGGCSVSPPLFCPDSPLTRGQMAAFLAKALGLYWLGASTGSGTYTVTTIPAVAFYPGSPKTYDTSSDLGRSGVLNADEEFFAPLDLPGGAVIDYIGLNTATDVEGVYGVDLVQRHEDGGTSSIGAFSSTVHGWATTSTSRPSEAP